MADLCTMADDYYRRLKAPDGKVIHAGRKSYYTACGMHIFVPKEKDRGRYYCGGYEFDRVEEITCKNCLRVLAADDAKDESNSDLMYAIKTKDGLYLMPGWEGKFSTAIKDARLYKSYKGAHEATLQHVYDPVTHYPKRDRRGNHVKEPIEGLSVVWVRIVIGGETEDDS